MMEKLGEPQTHLALKEMIKTVDEDNDNCISFREVCATVSFPTHQCHCLIPDSSVPLSHSQPINCDRGKTNWFNPYVCRVATCTVKLCHLYLPKPTI